MSLPKRPTNQPNTNTCHWPHIKVNKTEYTKKNHQHFQLQITCTSPLTTAATLFEYETLKKCFPLVPHVAVICDGRLYCSSSWVLLLQLKLKYVWENIEVEDLPAHIRAYAVSATRWLDKGGGGSRESNEDMKQRFQLLDLYYYDDYLLGFVRNYTLTFMFNALTHCLLVALKVCLYVRLVAGSLYIHVCPSVCLLACLPVCIYGSF